MYPVRSSHRRCSLKKGVFRNFAKFRKISHEACNFIKKRLWHKRFPVNFAKFRKTPFFKYKYLRTSFYRTNLGDCFLCSQYCPFQCLPKVHHSILMKLLLICFFHVAYWRFSLNECLFDKCYIFLLVVTSSILQLYLCMYFYFLGEENVLHNADKESSSA